MRNLLIIMSLVAVSCTTKTAGGYDVPEISPGIDYAEQPSVPMYEQMLLTGDVSAVTDYLLYDSGDYVISKYKFDENHRLIYCEKGGYEMGSDAGMRCDGFAAYASTLANLYFNDIWEEQNSAELKVQYGNTLHEMEFEWERNGRFSKYRLFVNGAPVTSKELGGTHRFEEYLYDANGFPQIAFSFDPEFEISAQLFFSDFDSHGNFRRLRVDYRTLSDYTVFRTIEYR